MRYYTKLKVFKNPKGTNSFNGQVATSYNWYDYAIVLNDQEIVIVEKAYSNTTVKHISNFQSLMGWNKTYHYVSASQGLSKLHIAVSEINKEIQKLQAELQNPRNRNLNKRKQRIEALNGQLLTIERLRSAQQKVKHA